MAEAALITEEHRESCRYLDGYFAQQFADGARPDYGYPKNHLPKTLLDGMEVVTGFMAAPK